MRSAGPIPRRTPYVATAAALEKGCASGILQAVLVLCHGGHMSDEPALRPDPAVGDTLVAVARNILAEARTAIEDPGKRDSKAVHDFRRQMKRWRALLRLLEPFLGEDGTRLRLQGRDLARALGGARDAQSALDALVDLAHHGLSPRSLATLRDRIEHLRQTAETTILTGDMRL